MRTCVLFLTIFTACLLCIDTASGLSLHLLTAPLLTAFIFCFPTIYFPRIVRSVVQLVIGETLVLICIVDCFCQEHLSSPITPQILSNILLSNSRETQEFISSFIGIDVLINWRMMALVLLLVLLPIGLFYQKKLRCGYKPNYWVLMAVISLCAVYEASASYRFAQLFCQHQDTQKMEGLIFQHYHEEVPTPFHRFIFACYSLEQSRLVLDDIKRSTFSAQIDSCSYLSPHIVLVIGESSNKHHSELYGYQLPTTPFQKKRRDAGNLSVFTDVVTPWNITSNAFLDLFSMWEYGMTDALCSKPLFPILFRRAGYSVTFFSNQYVLKGFRKRATNQAGHFFLADKEMSDSLFTFRNGKSFKFDLGLVEQYRRFKEEQNDSTPSLDIIHLVGQHFDYSERCPQDLRAFETKDYAARNVDDEAKKIIMQYDNATHYNDIVLDSILCSLEDENSIVIYIADHGEEVYDELPVHGRLFQKPTAAQAKYEFEVPMWIWCSASYRRDHPSVINRIKESVNKAFMTDDLPQLLLYLAGISCEWYDEKSNLLSPDYLGKPRTIAGDVNYDDLR